MLYQKSFQARIEDAGKVFAATVEKLKTIQADIDAKTEKNREQMDGLAAENRELEKLRTRTARQIEEIGKFMR